MRILAATQVRMMESATGTPHDAVFKQFLMHVDTARDFLDIHLPAELRAICDLDTRWRQEVSSKRT